ncbi:MAG: LysR family transcriptional regulator [Clostridia bacterium]|nr:LysR family transcriptional regulator [Clostridia bacterium]
MELLQLRYFLDSAETENFSKTAEKYTVPPSSVSISVKKLENEIGCSLFDRNGNKVSLNLKGKLLYGAVKKAIEELDGAVSLLSERSEEIGEINILIRSERRVIMQHIIEFKERFPNVVFHIMHDFNTTDIEKYHIIIDSHSDGYSAFKRFPLLSEKMRFAAGKNNPLCDKRLTLDMLYGQGFISMCEGSSMNRLTKEYCKRAGFTPNIIIECDDPYYIRKYIELDFGIALVPEISWQGELSDNVKYLDIIDFDERRVTYAYLNKSAGTNAVRFYEYIKNIYNSK